MRIMTNCCSRDPYRNEHIINQRVLMNKKLNSSLPWKIISVVLVLAVLVTLFLRHHKDTRRSDMRKPVIPNPEIPLPPSSSKLLTFKNAAVSSDSQVCSDIAKNVLKSSANVFDGALAALFCNSLTQLASTGLLGGFLLSAYIKSERRSVIVDAQITSPEAFRLPIQNLSHIKTGPLSTGVPGFLQGSWEIHQKYGSLPWAKLIEPTIKLCNNGIIITKHLHDSLQLNQRIIEDGYLREIFFDETTRKFKRQGSVVFLKKHCEFLKTLADHEGSNIYSGRVGEIIANDFKDSGSIITVDDLKDYKVKWSDSIEYSMTPDQAVLVPNTAAILIPSILNVLKKYKFNTSSFESQANVNESILTHHRIVEAFKHVFSKRSLLGDPDFVDVKKVVDHLLSEEFAAEVTKLIDDPKTQSGAKNFKKDYVAPSDHGTTHISLIAENGDAVSVTSSINYYFGAGISGKSSGLIFNNGMDDFSYIGRGFNYFGLMETPTNYAEHRKRALSSMSPMIVVDKQTGDVLFVVGAAGGSKIISAVTLVLLRFFCCTQNLKEIVDAPRFHHQNYPDEISYEYGVPHSTIEGLAGMGHSIKRFKNRGTIVNALSRQKVISGVADYRKDGSGVSGY